MSLSSHPAREQLAAYVRAELPEAVEEAVADHLDQCSRCEETVSSLEREAATFFGRLADSRGPEPFVDEPQCGQALERIRTEGPQPEELPPTELFGNSSSSPAPPLAQLREYRILERLGAGGMGTVYKALHTKLDKLVALKVLPAAAMQDAELVARFEREMKAVGKLEHPNIVRAMDAGCHEGTHFLVMEYVDGMDLAKIVKRCGRLRIADACEAVRQAALGLRHADENALVHRDIKPSNLVLSRDGEVKILDLGLALLEKERQPDHESTGAGRAMGTIDYMAPEQVRDSHSVDIRADIYGLGCTLYKLLAGQAPFSGSKYKNTFDKMMAHLNDPVPPIRQARPDAPEKLAAVLDRMLAKDRDARFAKPGQAIEDLKPFCPGHDLAGLLARAEKAAGAETIPPSPAAGPKRAGGLAPGAALATPPAVGAGLPTAPKTPTARSPESPFDPYYKWLGIPPEEQPPNHYRLLGIRVFEEDREVIQVAAERQAAHLKTRGLGKHSALSQELLNEVHKAKICLLVPEDKAAYDACLRQTLAAAAASPPIATEVGSAVGTEDDRDRFARLLADIPPVPAARPRRARLLKAIQGWLSRVPRYPWSATACAAAFFLVLGVIIRVRTGSGTVEIELPDPAEKSAVTVDGRSIDLGPRMPTAAQPSAANAPPLAVAPFDEKRAKEHQEAWARNLGVPVEMTNAIGMKFVLIPPGEFDMGQAPDEAGHFRGSLPSNETRHRVRLTKPYYLGATEVTQAQWTKTMGAAPWQGKRMAPDGSDLPASWIDYDQALAFCSRLGAADGAAYRLPTEAEWEHACRAGTSTAFHFGNTSERLGEYGWCRSNAQDQPHPVATKLANPWGLFDVHGNVTEWCSDFLGDYPTGGTTVDPTGPPSGGKRVQRGGAFWHVFHPEYRSAFRKGAWGAGGPENGLRVLREIRPGEAQSRFEQLEKKVLPSLVYVKAAGDARAPLGVVTDLGVCTVMPGSFEAVELATLDGSRVFSGRVASRSPFPFCWIDAGKLDLPPAARAEEAVARKPQDAFIVMRRDGAAKIHGVKIETSGAVSMSAENAPDPGNGVVAPGPVFAEDGTCLGLSLRPALDMPVAIYPLKRAPSPGRGPVHARSAEASVDPDRRAAEGVTSTAASPPAAAGPDASEASVWSFEAIRAGKVAAPELADARRLFHDDFDDPRSGLFRTENSDGQANYADGRYFLTGSRGGAVGIGGKVVHYTNFACRMVGRVVGPGEGWGVGFLDATVPGGAHKLHVSLKADGRLTLKRGFGGELREPVQHSAIKTIDEFNSILVVVRGRRVEVYVNGVAVCEPLLLDSDPGPLTPCLLTHRSQHCRIELEELTIWSF